MPPLPYPKALALKEAGWPQPDLSSAVNLIRGDWVRSPEPPFISAYSPSLEELIEACPKKWEGVFDYTFRLVYEWHKFKGEYGWFAAYMDEDGGIPQNLPNVFDYDQPLFLDPKEAVANLWLSIPPEVRTK